MSEVEYKEGFYHLYNPSEEEPVLVHGYHCTDMGGEFVFGFNTHDGGNLVPLSDLGKDSRVVPVAVSEQNNLVHPSDLKVWTCKIVVDVAGELLPGFDSPPRMAAQKVIEAAGFDVVMNSSGWGGELEEDDIRYLESVNLVHPSSE